LTAPFLIFGATGGVGRALTHQLAARGTPLFLAARSEDKVSELAQKTGANYNTCDVLDGSCIGRTVDQAVTEDGLAGLAYCVGSIVIKPLRSAREEDFVEAYRLNVVGAALAIRAAQKALEAANGSVVLFSTIAVGQGFPNHAVISAAKGGVEGLTRALAAELAPKVRVNAVAPSLTRTPLADSLIRSEAVAKGIAQMHAIPRLGEPDDIAAAAAFLLGPDSAWTTGQVMAVDGGRSRVRTKG